ncbi:class F sortase [Blastococcus sp. SYSU D00669]
MRSLTRPSRRTAALAGAAVLGLVGALLLVLGLAAGTGTAAGADAPAPAPAAPTSGAPAAPGSGSASSTPTPTAAWTPSSPVHLVVPSVGLDLPLLALDPRGDVIDPPLLTAGYWIEPYGSPVGSADRATNTLYVAAHSQGHGDDGFDPLLTADHRGSAVAAGDVVEVRTPQGTVPYTITGTQRIAKGALPGTTDVWEDSPGRLVLITCFQRADGRNSTENLVVFAES